jgi:hypothetical protein
MIPSSCANHDGVSACKFLLGTLLFHFPAVNKWKAPGGRVLADIFGGALPYMAQISDQKLVAPISFPEAAAYPAHMKSEVWVATDTQFYIVGRKGDEPCGRRRPICSRLMIIKSFHGMKRFGKRFSKSAERSIYHPYRTKPPAH